MPKPSSRSVQRRLLPLLRAFANAVAMVRSSDKISLSVRDSGSMLPTQLSKPLTNVSAAVPAIEPVGAAVVYVCLNVRMLCAALVILNAAIASVRKLSKLLVRPLSTLAKVVPSRARILLIVLALMTCPIHCRISCLSSPPDRASVGV